MADIKSVPNRQFRRQKYAPLGGFLLNFRFCVPNASPMHPPAPSLAIPAHPKNPQLCPQSNGGSAHGGSAGPRWISPTLFSPPRVKIITLRSLLGTLHGGAGSAERSVHFWQFHWGQVSADHAPLSVAEKIPRLCWGHSEIFSAPLGGQGGSAERIPLHWGH